MSDDEVKIDREQAFLLYATFCGDIVRTAHAIGVRPADVLVVAEAEDWQKKLAPILELKASAKPGDVERAVNRALNYVQARKAIVLLERTLNRLYNLTPEALEDELTRTDVNGNRMLVTRPLADLASALEKLHAMSYQALSDTAQDRAKRSEGQSSETSGSEMHAAIAAQMAKVRGLPSMQGVVLEAQIELAGTRNAKEKSQ